MAEYSEYGLFVHMINSEDQKLLDEIFCSNLGLRDEYIALAKKLELNQYLDLYKNDLK